MQVQRQQGRGGDKEIQRVVRRLNSKKDDDARSEGAEDAAAPQHRGAQGGLPQKRHSLPCV